MTSYITINPVFFYKYSKTNVTNWLIIDSNRSVMTKLTPAQVEEFKRLILDQTVPLLNEINRLKEENNLLKEKVASLESMNSSSVATTKPLFSDLFNGSTKKNLENTEINVLNAISVEQGEIKRKEKNIIIYGLNTNDANSKSDVEKVFDEIKVDKALINKVVKFKRNNDTNKTAPILVELTNKDVRIEIVKAAKKLKESTSFRNVFINFDLTIAQQALTKQLINERNKLNRELKEQDINNYYYGIRNNKIIKLSTKF